MEITLKNKCCLYVIIPICFFSITICNLLIDFPRILTLEWQRIIQELGGISSLLLAEGWQLCCIFG
jgi:hypothetical protein